MPWHDANVKKKATARKVTRYRAVEDDEALGALADAVRAAAERAVKSIDDALKFIEASNRRIAAMESTARRAARKVAR